MISFHTADNHLILSYTPEFDDEDNWVVKVLKKEGRVTLKKTYTFQTSDVHTWPSSNEERDDDPFYEQANTIQFIMGIQEGDYYRIKKGVLIDKVDIYIHQSVSVDNSFFVADPKVSIFQALQSLVSSDICVGGEQPSAIPEEGFRALIAGFPTPYERKKYVEARISAVLREYFGDMKDGEAAYHRYMNKKIIGTAGNLRKSLKDIELLKYQTILQKLEQMLQEEDGYSEKKWQEEILEILLLIYPKYIGIFREVPIRDRNIQERYVDYMLIDSSGYVDIVEIKRPFGKCIVTENKYRNNFIPLRDLSGTIMQLEKYIFYLNRWGQEGERFLTEKYRQALPKDFEIKITNPNGIIIMGRELNLSAEQKADFEVVKRKYKNVADILTYDNLLHRLRRIIEQIEKS